MSAILMESRLVSWQRQGHAPRGFRSGGFRTGVSLTVDRRHRSCQKYGTSLVVASSGDWLQEPLKHVIESQQFDKETLSEIFKISRSMEDIRPNTDESRQLQGRIMSTLFYEPSTRTRLSFESAMARLGGTVLSTESAGEYSSAAKGETLEGMLYVVYCNTIL